MLLFFLFSVTLGVTSAMDIVIPAYFKNETEWAAMASSCSQIGITAILNPGNGPGEESRVKTFAKSVNNVRAAGGKVVGYIFSKQTNRSISLLKSDIDQYVAWYSIDGFFVDNLEKTGAPAAVQYYQDLYSYIKAKNKKFTVILNAGADFPEAYVTSNMGDRFVSIETDQERYGGKKPLSWQSKYPASKFIHLVYNANAAQMKTVVDSAVAKGAGGIYVTNGKYKVDLWKGIPPYWNQEVAYVKKRRDASLND